MKKGRKKKPEPRPLALGFRSHGPRWKFPYQHDPNRLWRIFKTGDGPDCFNIIDKKDLETVEIVCSILGIQFIDYDEVEP
jgi:hypothetical protein